MPSVSELFASTPANTERIQKYSQPQQDLLNQLTGLASQQLGKSQQPFNFAPIAQQARKQFATQTVPSIAERFTAMGGDSRLGSSGFAGQIGAAGSQLEEALASLKSQVGLQQQGRQDQMLQMLLGGALQPQFESVFTPKQPGVGAQITAPAIMLALSHLLPGLGNLLGKGIGGLSSLFGGGSSGAVSSGSPLGAPSSGWGSGLGGLGGGVLGSALGGPIGGGIGSGLGSLFGGLF